VSEDRARELPFDRALLERWRPALLYDAQEPYRAILADSITDNPGNRLQLADNTVLRRAGDGEEPPFTLELLTNYPDGRTAMVGDRLVEESRGGGHERVAARFQADPHYADRVYGRVASHGGYTWLQYWLWFYYNRKHILGVGEHEGDWEMVQVALRPGREWDEPDLVTCSQHESGEARTWDRVERESAPDGDHPAIYVAPLSHALYFEAGAHPYFPGVDDPDGSLPPVLPKVEELGPWRSWKGLWGNSKGVGRDRFSSSPKSPANQGTRWGEPERYHREGVKGSRWRQLGRVVRFVGKLSYPRLDRVTAHLAGERLQVSYELKPGLRPRAKLLYVTVRRLPDPDAGPGRVGEILLTKDQEIERPKDSLELQLPVSLHECVVTVSAVNRLRQRSNPLTVRARQSNLSSTRSLRESNLRWRRAARRREEREELGFLRQPMVRWLDPGVLVRAGPEVGISALFGRFTDKRELQTLPQEIFNYSWRRQLWFDYLSDTGDGFEPTYAMAWLLSRRRLDVEGVEDRLPRADVLLLGGDQVYPSASPEAYEDRFVGPFGAAFPRADEYGAPDLFAVPGNHDWYDGLTSFLRIFCQRGWVGGWRKRQKRSYFALQLPHRWWVWGIDIQLDTYLDRPQLDYFEHVAESALAEGDKVILLTAKPSWVKAEDGRLEPRSWRYLAYFEQQMIREKGAELALTVTGDLHHYSRYEPEAPPEPIEGGYPPRITAGGGGAYLSCTHTLPPKVELKTWEEKPVVEYRCKQVYPDESWSRKRRKRVLFLPRTNPWFAFLLACVYGVFAIAVLFALNAGQRGLVEEATRSGFDGFLATAASGVTVVLALLLWAALAGYADFSEGRPPALRPLWKLLTGLLHAALHIAAIAGAVYALAELLGPDPEGIFLWLSAVPASAIVGFAAGTFVFASVLLVLHRILGAAAPMHANEVFASQGIKDRKNFLRFHLRPDGQLEIYALGVDEVPTRWRYHGRSETEPWFTPAGGAPSVRLIDSPAPIPPP
jgi:Calcineurin-like phosphoesterase